MHILKKTLITAGCAGLLLMTGITWAQQTQPPSSTTNTATSNATHKVEPNATHKVQPTAAKAATKTPAPSASTNGGMPA